MARERPWSVVECELLRRAYPTANVNRIAKVLKRPVGAVRNKAVRMGLKRSPYAANPDYQRWTEAEDAELLKLRSEGLPHEACALRLGRSLTAVQMRYSRLTRRKNAN